MSLISMSAGGGIGPVVGGRGLSVVVVMKGSGYVNQTRSVVAVTRTLTSGSVSSSGSTHPLTNAAAQATG